MKLVQNGVNGLDSLPEALRQPRSPGGGAKYPGQAQG